MRDKHQVNVKKSSLVNFQIGLIAALTFVYIMFEVFTTSQTIVKVTQDPFIDENPPTITFTVVPDDDQPKKEIARVERKVKKVIIRDEIKKVDDNTPDLKEEPAETPDKDTPIASVDEPKASTSKPVKPVAPVRPSNINIVEFAPVYPGCEKLKTNPERVACFQKKIQRMISRKFNSGLGEYLGLKGQQRIHVLFEIDAYGHVQNIKARAPHPRLQKEAIRVTKQLPKMTPARQGENNVAIQYALPIVFDVRS